MAKKYAYTISTEIPGGAWESASTSRLQTLAVQQISTTLLGVNVKNDVLEVVFDADLTPADKALLDGNQTAPVGGLLAAAVQTVGVLFDDVLKTDNSRETVQIDGIKFRRVRLQIHDGFGQPTNASGQAVTLDPSCVCAINVLDGFLDENGGFDFILGPDVRRGNVTITASVAGFSPKTIGVSFR